MDFKKFAKKLAILFFLLAFCINCSGYDSTYTKGYSPSIENNKFYYDNEMYYSNTGINKNRYKINPDTLNQTSDQQIVYVPIIIRKEKKGDNSYKNIHNN